MQAQRLAPRRSWRRRTASRRCGATAAAAAEHRAAIDETVLDRHHVKKSSGGTERRGHPVRRSANGGTCGHAVLIRRVSGHELRASVRPDAARPRQLLHERLRQQHLSVGAIEHIEETVAIRLQQQLSRLTLKHRVDQNRRLLRIPIPQIMRSELIVPSELPGFGVEREDRVRVQVVPLPLAAIRIRIRIACRPEKRIGRGVVSARQPGSATTFFEIDRTPPGVGCGLTSSGHGPEPPRLLARIDAIRRKETPNALVAARHAGDDQIADHERRHRAAVGLLRVFRKHDFPKQRAVHPAHRQQMRVVCDKKHARAEHRGAAIETDSGVAAKPCRPWTREAPDLAPGRRVDRRHLVGRGDVHDAVEHERRHLVVETTHGMNPLHRQVPDVRRRNLRERAMPVSIEPPVIRRPVAGRAASGSRRSRSHFVAPAHLSHPLHPLHPLHLHRTVTHRRRAEKRNQVPRFVGGRLQRRHRRSCFARHRGGALVHRNQAAVDRLQRQHMITFVADESAQRATVFQSARARSHIPAQLPHWARRAPSSIQPPSSAGRCWTDRAHLPRPALGRCGTSNTVLFRRRTTLPPRRLPRAADQRQMS